MPGYRYFVLQFDCRYPVPVRKGQSAKVNEKYVENKEKEAVGILGLAAVGGLIYWFTKKPKQ